MHTQKQKMLILLLSLSLVLGLTACSKPVDIPLADILTEIEGAIKADYLAEGHYTEEDFVDGTPGVFAGSLLDDETHVYLTDPDLIDPKLLSEGHVLAAMFIVRSDEIIVLKAKDKGSVKTLQAALEQEKANRLKQWETYLPDQHEKVKQTIIKTEGQYLLYATWDDPKLIETAFTKAISGK